MKNTLFFIFLPCFCFAQGFIRPTLVKDTSYIVNVQGIYTLVDEQIYLSGDTARTKQILGDSASASFFLLSQSENQSNIVADIIFPELNAKENKRKIREYTRLYNSFNNRNVYAVTAIRDTAEMLGTWNLIFEGLLSAFVKDIDRYFPGQLLSIVAQGGTDRISYQYALFTSYAFLIVGLSIVAFLFKKRDVAN